MIIFTDYHYSAILSSIFLNEKLGKDGIIGCFLCILGSLTVILHAPEEDAIETVEDVFHHFTQPAFMLYMMIIIGVSLYLIYKVRLKFKINPTNYRLGQFMVKPTCLYTFQYVP